MNIDFKRFLCPLLAVLLCFLSILCFKRISDENHIVVSAVVTEPKLIIIDAGHGGIDGGAVGYNNILEKNINLSIAKKLETMLTCCGFEVIMTRTEDSMVGDRLPESASIREKKVNDVKYRVSLINSHPNAIVLSIHQNLFSESKYSGAQMFYSTKNTDSKAIATFLQNRFSTMLQPENTRAIKPVSENIYLMNNINNPAVLVECGFISNGLEAQNLTDDIYQNKIAFVIFASLCDFFEKDTVNDNTFK